MDSGRPRRTHEAVATARRSRGWDTPGARPTAVVATMALVAVGLLAGCGPDSSASRSASPTATRGQTGTPGAPGAPVAGATTPDATQPASTPPSSTTRPRTQEYLPGLDADIYPPTAPATGVVVVLIPGGGWTSADRSGLGPLATSLAASGASVVNATYRTAATQTYFPAPLQDVTCAVAFAAASAAAGGHGTHPLIVVGHSAGANLAALAALAPDHADSCPYPAAPADAFVGLAGPYDVDELPSVAIALFGVPPRDDPDLWAAGNPARLAAGRPEVPALLLHGRADSLVPVSFTTEFAAALRAGGHQVTVDVVRGADHSGIYRKDVAADRLIDWIGALR